ncbi:MAG: HAMP domain-containing sensor histidine kinase [Alphaproteobacteria bacterium]|nr:HAMP domain-containing sensor histidine kinase [Alphaproteobacteria bacterium]
MDSRERRLSKNLGWIAGTIAVLTAIVIPTIYFASAYTFVSERIETEAESAAKIVSEIAVTQPRMWRFQAHLIEARLSSVGRPGHDTLHTVSDLEGGLALSVGQVPQRPTLTRTADIYDGPKIVGQITTTESILVIVERTLAAAALGVILGVAMYLALLTLPMRALGRVVRQLEAANDELRSAQVELLGKERLAAIGQVTATVGHELRNPLGAIRSALAVVRKLARDEDPMMKESLDISDRGITRCDAIIGDLLDFTRRWQLNRESTAIDGWLRTVVEEYELPAPVRLRLEPEGGIEIPVDRDRLRSVVVNLIDNACHAMDANEPAGIRAKLLTVGARVNGERLEIAVRDTGHGMVPEVAAKAFEPLYSTKAFGVGLGLPMVKKVMEQHGGGVDITSQEERGTEVVLWLPLTAEARGEAA